MSSKKKTILQRIPLGAKLLAGLIILSIAMTMTRGSTTPVEAVETGLLIFICIVGICVVALVLIALVVSAQNKKRKLTREEEHDEEEDNHEDEEDADEAHTLPEPHHPPAHAGGHGHDSHGGASGALGWLLLAIVLGVLALVNVGKKAGFGVIPGVGGYGRDVGARAPADYSSHQDGVSLDWVPFKAPTSTWYTIRSKPGYDVEVCDPVADPNCTDPPLRGYRARCVDMTATEKVWTQSGCRNFIQIMIQATGRDPLPLVWRHVPRVNP